MSLYYYGLRDTTATYAVNFLNLIPIITFIFAIIARVEALRLHTWAGRVKIIGAVLCVAGALSTSLYKGKSFYIFHHDIKHSEALVKNVKHNWMRGTLMLTGSCFCYSTWYMLQVKMNKIFPLKVLGTILIITGLYSYLWGKRKESKAVPRQAHLATVDVEAAEIESVGASSTAVIVPSSSPARDHDQTGVEITPTKKDDVQ
ncbi:hypothetical protein CRG98_010975 [Punica granatum]|uniref:Uncharacterized protein n=1 Tax=Punica granatum TaxID=22663 RepID=A0A2I0KJK4_PUNGR|nr:hypothetical protein CRG98_010975 [Punica granatum]